MGAFEKQLINAREDSAIQEVAAVCSTGDQYRDLVNQAIRLLMDRGGWIGSEVVMRLCGTGCNAVFPRYVGTILGLRPGCGEYIEIRNHWWTIMPPSWGASWGAGFGAGSIGSMGGNYSPEYLGGIRSGVGGTAVDVNNVPTFNQVSGNTGKIIRYHVVNSEDYGKTITLYGKKYGGQPLQQQIGGVTENGLTIVAATPLAQTTDLVTKIDAVVRQPTVSPAYLYEYDPATTLLRMLAAYEPSETNPSYRQMRIPSNVGCCRVDENGENRWQVDALVKLNFIPAVSDNDFLAISNMDAIAMAIQSIKARRANDLALARESMKDAIETLNFELRNKSPSDQLVVKVDAMGGNRMLTSPY
jgi:hypothetical protein